MTDPTGAPEVTGRVPKAGSWAELIAPVVMHFDIAAQFGLDASWNAEGAAACSELWKHMARLLDDEVQARVDAKALAAGAALDAMEKQD